MSKKKAQVSDDSITSTWKYLLPTYWKEDFGYIYLTSDDEVEVLPSPPKRQKSTCLQDVNVSYADIKSADGNVQLTAKTVVPLTEEAAGCSRMKTLACIDGPNMVGGVGKLRAGKETDIQSSQSSCSPLKNRG